MLLDCADYLLFILRLAIFVKKKWRHIVEVSFPKIVFGFDEIIPASDMKRLFFLRQREP